MLAIDLIIGMKKTKLYILIKETKKNAQKVEYTHQRYLVQKHSRGLGQASSELHRNHLHCELMLLVC